MNRKPIAITIAIALAALAVWKWPQLRAGFLAPPAPQPAATQEAEKPKAEQSDEPTPENQVEPDPTPEQAPPELTTPEAQPSALAKCLDGSALTVTGSDGSQTSYKCESGAVGAYLN